MTWTNRDGFAHSVRASDQSFGSEPLDQGGTYQFTFPAAGELGITFIAHDGGVYSGEETLFTTSPSGTNAADVQSTGSLFCISSLYVGGANAGNVVLQWAQNASSVSATTVKAQSTLWGCKLA